MTGDRLLRVGRNTDVQFTQRFLTFGARTSSRRLYKYSEGPSGQGHNPYPRAIYTYCLRPIDRHGPHQASIRVQHPQEPKRVSSRFRRRQQRRHGRMGQSLETAHRPRYGSYVSQHVSRIRIDSDTVSPDLVDSPVVTIDADESVEVACDVRILCGCYVCHSWFTSVP
jgi:hypothetical protein